MTHFVVQGVLCHIWDIPKLAPTVIGSIYSADQRYRFCLGFCPLSYAQKVQCLANFCLACDYVITSVLDKEKAVTLVSFAHVCAFEFL